MAKAHSPGFLRIAADAKSQVTECTVADVDARIRAAEPFVLVDVREESEWIDGHLPGAIHLSKGIIERDVETRIPDSTTPVVVYCGGGFRSALVAVNLQKMGYTNVVSMDGGVAGWTAAGHTLREIGRPI